MIPCMRSVPQLVYISLAGCPHCEIFTPKWNTQIVPYARMYGVQTTYRTLNRGTGYDEYVMVKEWLGTATTFPVLVFIPARVHTDELSSLSSSSSHEKLYPQSTVSIKQWLLRLLHNTVWFHHQRQRTDNLNMVILTARPEDHASIQRVYSELYEHFGDTDLVQVQVGESSPSFRVPIGTIRVSYRDSNGVQHQIILDDTTQDVVQYLLQYIYERTYFLKS